MITKSSFHGANLIDALEGSLINEYTDLKFNPNKLS